MHYQESYQKKARKAHSKLFADWRSKEVFPGHIESVNFLVQQKYVRNIQKIVLLKKIIETRPGLYQAHKNFTLVDALSSYLPVDKRSRV